MRAPRLRSRQRARLERDRPRQHAPAGHRLDPRGGEDLRIEARVGRVQHRVGTARPDRLRQ